MFQMRQVPEKEVNNPRWPLYHAKITLKFEKVGFSHIVYQVEGNFENYLKMRFSDATGSKKWVKIQDGCHTVLKFP